MQNGYKIMIIKTLAQGFKQISEALEMLLEEPKTEVKKSEEKTSEAIEINYLGKKYIKFQECKYKCGNLVSFDHYGGDVKNILHLTPEYQPIGFQCPKYANQGVKTDWF